jgi:hypothetical protein
MRDNGAAWNSSGASRVELVTALARFHFETNVSSVFRSTTQSVPPILWRRAPESVPPFEDVYDRIPRLVSRCSSPRRLWQRRAHVGGCI